MHPWVRNSLIALVVLIGGGALAYWATSVKTPLPDRPIAEQWIQAVRQFGLEPVYPPQEDFVVGDILAIITGDATLDISKEPLPTRSLKLYHMDLTADLEAAYKGTYLFPATQNRPTNKTDIWSSAASEESIFKIGAARKSLPIAMLPSFSLATVRGASLSGSGLAGALGLEASGDSAVEMKVDGVETYGVPALPAETALIEFCTGAKTAQFCTDNGVRTQLSMIVGQKIFDTIELKDSPDKKKIPRYSVEIALVSRAYLVRSVETLIKGGSGVKLQGATTSKQEPKPQDKPDDDGAATNGDTAESNGAEASADPNAADDAKARLTRKTALAATASAPGASTVIERADGSTLSVTKTFERPIVIGFRSVRWRPGT